MPGDKIFGALKTLTLAQLSDWVWDKESAWGPIKDIGHTAEGSCGTFHFDPDEPTEQAVLKIVLAGQQLTVPGKTEICRGTVFVLGQLTQVAVFR